jgi:hypothetical protein
MYKLNGDNQDASNITKVDNQENRDDFEVEVELEEGEFQSLFEWSNELPAKFDLTYDYKV